MTKLLVRYRRHGAELDAFLSHWSITSCSFCWTAICLLSINMWSIPQGYILGPLLFTLYTVDVISITQSLNGGVHCYADDLQLNVHCRAGDATAAIERLLRCIGAMDGFQSLKKWILTKHKSSGWAAGNSWLISTMLFFIYWTALSSSPSRAFVISASLSTTQWQWLSTLTILSVPAFTKNDNCALWNIHFPTMLSRCLFKLLCRADRTTVIPFSTVQITSRLQPVLNAAARLVTGLGRSELIIPT